jgi:hypothetical protein
MDIPPRLQWVEDGCLFYLVVDCTLRLALLRYAGHCGGVCSSSAAKKMDFDWLDRWPIIFAPAAQIPLYLSMRIFLPFFSPSMKRIEELSKVYD